MRFSEKRCCAVISTSAYSLLMKKPAKKWRMTIALPEAYRAPIEAKIKAGDIPTAAWWIQRVVRLALEAEGNR